jgi:hypothetical protein
LPPPMKAMVCRKELSGLSVMGQVYLRGRLIAHVEN